MSRQLHRQLVRYRGVLVAIANGAITWVVLIIAPLGLFAVIVCTGMVVLASLVTGYLGDVALLALLESADPALRRAMDRRRSARGEGGDVPVMDASTPPSLPRQDEQQ